MIVCVAIVALVTPLHSAFAADELIAISEFFAIRRVSGSALFRQKREGNEIFVRVPGQDPQYLGFTEGGLSAGVTLAVSKDGRSLVFRQSGWTASSESRPEPGIF